MTKLFCVVLFALSMAGCGLHYAVPAGYRPPDYGQPISQQKAEDLAKRRIRKSLVRPAQYRFEKIYRGGRTKGNKVYYGYVLVAHVNAQTVFGKKYKKTWLFVIRDGQIVFEKWNFVR